MKCDCLDWKPNIDKINGYINLGAVHGVEYDGKTFAYCPWCGLRLMADSEVIPEEDPDDKEEVET